MASKKKYELIDSTVPGLYRVKALRDFGDVKAGDIGGYVEKEANLSHDGNCWVYDNARVGGDANISDNALIKEDAYIYENARVYDTAVICGKVHLKAHVIIMGDILLEGEGRLFNFQSGRTPR